MTPRQSLIAYVAALAAFLALDAVWLSVLGPRLYRPALGASMREQPDLLAAALFYLVYLAGVIGFAVRPALGPLGGGGATAATRGAAFGLVAYATYDLTNQATLAGWPWHVTLVDLAWGAAVTAAGATAGWRAARAAGARG